MSDFSDYNQFARLVQALQFTLEPAIEQMDGLGGLCRLIFLTLHGDETAALFNQGQTELRKYRHGTDSAGDGDIIGSAERP